MYCLDFCHKKDLSSITISSSGVNLMTLVAGCFEYTFINDSKPTDNVPIIIFLLGISLVIKVVSGSVFIFQLL